MRQPVHGILLLDKPINMTSNGALQRIKRLFNAKKAGHTGSLDPIATGMLPICFGEATKFSQFLLESDKTYHVVAKLGIQTTTGDREGEVIATQPIENINVARVKAVMEKWIGEIEQVPPMYSAIKFQGDPLYKLARQGIEVERKPRKIRIFSLRLLHLTEDELSFNVHCSKGTYVRTLVEDITRELGCCGHVIALNREMVSPYQDAPMVTLTEIEALAEVADMQGLKAHLLPIETAVKHFPAVTLSTAAAFYLRTGQPVRVPYSEEAGLVRLLAEDGRFLGIGEMMYDRRVKPHRLIEK